RDGERHALTIRATRPRRHGLDTVPGRPAAPVSASGSPRDSFVGPDAYPPGKRPAVIFRRPRRDAVLPALGLLVAFASTDVGATPTALRDGRGIHVEATEQLDARQLEVRVSTSALQRPVDVRVLLPSDYDATPDRRYPVLYLFHGTSGRASDWVNFGRAAETTAALPLIVVMPDAGFDGDGGGWFANWFNGGAGGQPMWETFHIEQLVPWIDDNLRTVAKRSGRAVAGLSQGGFGSLSYAARPPPPFTSVAALSRGCGIGGQPPAVAPAPAPIPFP